MSITETRLASVRANAITFSFNWLTRQVLAAVFIYSIWPAIANYHYWFSWHVIFCTFGYIPLMAEAIMLFAGDQLWSRQVSRHTKYYIHGVLIGVGTIFLTVGTFILTYYTQTGHFQSIHAITGLISMVLSLVSIAVGYCAFYSQKLSKYCRPVVIKGLHNLLGIFAYIIGIVSLAYGYYTNWFVYFTDWKSRIVATVALAMFSVCPLNTAFISAYKQIKTIFSNYN